MHLTEALIVGFLAFTENAHYAVKPLLALITALGGQFNHFGLDRLGEHRRLSLLVVESHHRGALLRGKLQAVGAEACRGVGHRQPHYIGFAVKGKLRRQLDA